MTLKTCSCKAIVTTKNAVRVIRHETGLYFNCSQCDSTLMIRNKKQTKKVS